MKLARSEREMAFRISTQYVAREGVRPSGLVDAVDIDEAIFLGDGDPERVAAEARRLLGGGGTHAAVECEYEGQWARWMPWK